jgi:hypothetical protein
MLVKVCIMKTSVIFQLYPNYQIYSVLEMKIWIYWSESNSWIYFYIVLDKNWKIYWSEQSGPATFWVLSTINYWLQKECIFYTDKYYTQILTIYGGAHYTLMGTIHNKIGNYNIIIYNREFLTLTFYWKSIIDCN